MDTPVRGADMEELYRRLQPSGRRSKTSHEPVVAAAVEAAQRSAAEVDAENAAQDVTPNLALDSGFAICSRLRISQSQRQPLLRKMRRRARGSWRDFTSTIRNSIGPDICSSADSSTRSE